MDITSCSLCGRHDCQTGAVPAGEVSSSLAVCGYETAIESLPRVFIAEQRYKSGLCPACASVKGTLFPELISEY